MRYHNIGKTDINVSSLSLGAFGMGGGTAWGAVDDVESIKIIHKAKELGINLIDTAPVYGAGHSEIVVGKAMEGRRSDFIVETKCSLQWRDQRGQKEYDRDGNSVYRCFESDSLVADLEHSLKRLNTDYVDIYVLHRQPASLDQVAEIYATLSGLKKEGKIRAIGLSNTNSTFLAEYLKHGPIDMVQEQFNLVEQGAMTDYIPLCEKETITFQCFSALERGLLTGRYRMDYQLIPGHVHNNSPWFAPERRQLALDMLDSLNPLCEKYNCSTSTLILAYTMQISPIFNTLVGVRQIKNLEDSVQAAQLSISAEDLKTMDEASALMHQRAKELS